MIRRETIQSWPLKKVKSNQSISDDFSKTIQLLNKHFKTKNKPK